MKNPDFLGSLLEYRKSGKYAFQMITYLSISSTFLQMKAFEFEVAPEQVRDFLKECLQAEHLSSAQESWTRGILPSIVFIRF